MVIVSFWMNLVFTDHIFVLQATFKWFIIVYPKGIVFQEIALTLFRRRAIFWTILRIKRRLKIGCVSLELHKHIRIFFNKIFWCSILWDIIISHCLDSLLMNLLIVKGIARYVTFRINIIAHRVIGWFVKWVFWLNWIYMDLILEYWCKTIN